MKKLERPEIIEIILNRVDPKKCLVVYVGELRSLGRIGCSFISSYDDGYGDVNSHCLEAMGVRSYNSVYNEVRSFAFNKC